jgi:hypothetical protein
MIPFEYYMNTNATLHSIGLSLERRLSLDPT